MHDFILNFLVGVGFVSVFAIVFMMREPTEYTWRDYAVDAATTITAVTFMWVFGWLITSLIRMLK